MKKLFFRRSNFCCLLNLVLIISFVFALGCNNHKTREDSSLCISNGGVSWNFWTSLGSGAWGVVISGEEERKIIQEEDLSAAILLNCLSNSNKWKAAHVLLTMRFDDSWVSTVDQWNGMKISSEFNEIEMQKIQRYWYEKKERGELEEASPVFPEEALKRIFGIEEEETPESRSAKIEEFFKENPVNMDVLSEDLFGDGPPMTNPPPRGAEGGGDSKEINPFSSTASRPPKGGTTNLFTTPKNPYSSAKSAVKKSMGSSMGLVRLNHYFKF